MLDVIKLEVVLISDERSFESISAEWDLLLRQSTADNIFLTWEWAYTWWKSYKEGKELFLVVVKEGSRIVGIAPFYITKTLKLGLKQFRYVEFIGSVGTCSEYLDFIVLKDREDEIIKAILDEVFLTFKDRWDIFNLDAYNERSKNLHVLDEYFAMNKIKHKVSASMEAPYIALPRTMDEYYEHLSRKTRYKFKKIKSKLTSEFCVSTIVADEAQTPFDYYEIFIALHYKRWQEKSGVEEDDGFSVSRTKFHDFHRQIVKLFFEKKWLYLVFLKVNEKIVAGQYNFIYGNKIYNYSVGFDPEWSNYSVGIVLQLMVLEDIINKGLLEFDFLRGDEEYKYYWTKLYRKGLNVIVWRSKMTHAAVTIGNNLRRSVKFVLPKKMVHKIYNNLFVRKDEKN